jgi:hypothetical protein
MQRLVRPTASGIFDRRIKQKGMFCNGLKAFFLTAVRTSREVLA